ncbi:MAG: DUF1772 domain-containing protein [Anaerolineae bacterium]|nr:DUF1772 domain-containing protein [Anaerolineae bacterium]
MPIINVLIIFVGTVSGLLAGLLFGFSTAVIPGLRAMPARQHIAAMQAINVKIVNPVFLLSFLGPTILLPLAAWLQREGAAFPWLLAAALLHIVGVNGVTIAGNVPLNDALDNVDAARMADDEAERIRQAYHGAGARWMVLHHVRTAASVTATALTFAACFVLAVSE